MWGEFFEKMLRVSDNVPTIEIKCDSKGTVLEKAPWDCTSLKRKKREKDRAWAAFDTEPTSIKLSYALNKQAEYQSKQSKCMIKYERKITASMKTNPKKFFKYLNSKRKIKHSVTLIKDTTGKLSDSPGKSANLLAEFFSGTVVNESFGPLPNSSYKECSENIDDLIVNELDVKRILEGLDIYKSVGPDKIHPKLLANLSNNTGFVRALTQLYNNCFESGCIPAVWKTAHVTAIHKKGCMSDARNYRPISLTCVLCKVYEKIVRSHILDHIAPKIVPQQHGFTSGRSCLSNLLEFIDASNDLIEAGDSVDIFYMDFQKAFDTVPHHRLLRKLENLGINGKTLAMISDFLSGRTFQARVGDSLSQTYEVMSGVPQGSVLGPLLFLIYINDLPEDIKRHISLFADDVKMLTKSSAMNINQQDINKLLKWQDSWLLKFNTDDDKCKVLHIGKDNPCHKYYLGDIELPVVSCEKDLGVFVSNDLHWGDNIYKSIGKTRSVVGWVSRSVICRVYNYGCLLNVCN